LQLQGDASVARGALVTANARIAPFALTLSATRVTGGAATLRVQPEGGRLTATLAANDLAMHAGELNAGVAYARFVATGPPEVRGRLAGPVQLTLDATRFSLGFGAVQESGGRVEGAFQGDIDADASRQQISGRLRATADRTTIRASRDEVRQGVARLDLVRLVLTRDPQRLSASFDGRGSVAAQGARVGDASVRTASSVFRLSSPGLARTATGWIGKVSLTGSLEGEGGLATAAARRVAAAPLLGLADPAYRIALAKALANARLSAPAWAADFSDHADRVSLTLPLRLQAASGAQLSLVGDGVSSDSRTFAGRARLTLAGGRLPDLDASLDRWSATSSSLQADGDLKARLDALIAKGLNVEIKGRAVASGPRFRFDLSECAAVAAERLALDPNPVVEVAGRICANGGPLIETGPGGWRARGGIEAAHAVAPSFQADLSQASGAFSAAETNNEAPTIAVTLERGRIADLADPKRFLPVAASGRASLGAGVWTGDFAAATPAGRPIAKLHVRHDVATGVGSADIDARALAFAPGALQPAELTPMAAFAKDAQGPAAFTGVFEWTAAGARSRGELVAHGLRFKSPPGAVLGLDADIHFVSLAPLISGPNQSIAVREVQGLAPLEGVSAVFDFNADAADLARANAGFYGGQVRLESMRVPFGDAPNYKGVLDFDHVDLGKIIAGSNLSDQVKVDAVINGRIPFEAGPDGIAIRNGQLAAVRPGRISIARAALKGSATANAPAAPPNVAEDLAYQAMENLAFDKLDATVTSIPGDRLSMIFHIRGRHDPPKPQRATIAVSDLLAGRAMQKPISLPSGTEINLTLDTTLNFGELVRAIGETWRESLGQAPKPGRSAPVQGAGASLPASQ